MKTRYIILLAVLGVALLASCQKKEAAFEDSASARMEKFLDSFQEVISNPTGGNGWYMAYFTDQDKTAGGSIYTIQFDKPAKGEATIFHEDVKPAEGWGDTCNYKLTRDDGPVLSFDTYNVAMHYFSTSSPTYYQSQGGDFEFEIMSACPDSVVMSGKRSHNIFKLFPLPEAPDTYIQKIQQMNMDLTVGLVEAEITGGLIQMELDLNKRTITIGRKDAAPEEQVSVPYIITPEGFRLYEPLNFQGLTFMDFKYDANEMQLSSNGITFNMVIPEGFMKYDRYIGKYVMTTGELGNFNVEIAQNEYNRSYWLKGLNSNFDVKLVYNAGQGAINWLSQVVGHTDDEHEIWLCSWARLGNKQGYFTWDPTVGLRSVVDDTEAEAFVLTLTDNGDLINGDAPDSFILFDYTGYLQTQAFAAPPSSWYFTGGNYGLKGPFTLTKIVE